MSDDPPELRDVSVRLIGYERTPGSGTLLGLLSAEVAFSGGEVMQLQGCQIRRAANGNIELLGPQFGSRDGRWRDAVILPDPIMLAMLDECQAEWFTPAQLNFLGTAPQVLFGAVAVSAR